MPDWGPALQRLGLSGEDWGPSYRSTYAELVAGWRGSVSCPSESSLLAELEAHLAAQSARDKKAEIIDAHNADAMSVLKGLILSLNDGSFVPGSGYSAATIKAKIKAKM
jgi:hypothetical protein